MLLYLDSLIESMVGGRGPPFSPMYFRVFINQLVMLRMSVSTLKHCLTKNL